MVRGPGDRGLDRRARPRATDRSARGYVDHPVAYLDSSALVKLIAVQPETAALRRELAAWPDRVSSVLTRIEVGRVARRLGGKAPQLASNLLTRLDLPAIERIVTDAVRIGGPLLRTLDAIHLATAASIAGELGTLMSYDERMISETRAIGLHVVSPM